MAPGYFVSCEVNYSQLSSSVVLLSPILSSFTINIECNDSTGYSIFKSVYVDAQSMLNAMNIEDYLI